jgi:MATE family multidrug resistance protein
VSVFLDDAAQHTEILTLSKFMMIGLATYVMADALLIISGGVLRGAGDTKWLMWTSVLIHWFMLLVQYFVIKVWDMGSRASWIVFVFMVLATAVIYMIRLYGGKWRTEEALARVMAEQ